MRATDPRRSPPCGRPTPVGARGSGSRDCLDDADELPVFRALLLELHLAVLLGKQGVVATDADVDACVKTRATLANDDVAGNDFLAAKDFTPKRLLSESRPFLLLPPAFLCAMSVYL